MFKFKTNFLVLWLMLFFFALPISHAGAAEDINSWAYKIPIAVGNAPVGSENPTEAITNTIFWFGPIDTASLIAQNKMRPDCGDIRITDTESDFFK